jgi:hypothetical protein
MLASLLVAGSAVHAPAAAPSTNAPPPAATNAVLSPALPLPAPAYAPHVRKFRAVDADGHAIVLNRPGLITLVVGTSEDSQDAARAAGKAVYPFEGRPDFALIVVVDLRHTIASWVPSIVLARMKVSLDQEAFELKPYFLKNGNHNNPRSYVHVAPDFTGSICPQLDWKEHNDKLRVIIFGVDGRELTRIDDLDADDMGKVQEEVRKAIKVQVDVEQARLATAGKPPPGRNHITLQHPPLVPYTPWPVKKSD